MIIQKLLLVCSFMTCSVDTLNHDISRSFTKEANELLVDNAICMHAMEASKRTLVTHIQSYIKIKSNDRSLVDASEYVRVYDIYDLDIIFMLSHHLLESHFGAYGKARRTNSIANVGTWDDGTIRYRYDSPNYSIEPYARLIINDYIRDRNLIDVLKTKQLKTRHGFGFSTNPDCETLILNKMDKIKRNTEIDSLLADYKLKKEKYNESRERILVSGYYCKPK